MHPEHRIDRLAVVANATLVFPFVAMGSIYGCWLLAGRILGHTPVVSIDDPAETLSAGGAGWLVLPIVWLVMVPILPVFITSVLSNIAYVVKRRPSAAQAGIRVLTAASIWLSFWIWVYNDPNRVMEWWID